MTKQVYTGILKRGAAENTIEGYLVDAFGWKIHIDGVKTPGGYELRGTIGDPPDALRIPLLDGEKKKATAA